MNIKCKSNCFFIDHLAPMICFFSTFKFQVLLNSKFDIARNEFMRDNAQNWTKKH